MGGQADKQAENHQQYENCWPQPAETLHPAAKFLQPIKRKRKPKLFLSSGTHQVCRYYEQDHNESAAPTW